MSSTTLRGRSEWFSAYLAPTLVFFFLFLLCVCCRVFLICTGLLPYGGGHQSSLPQNRHSKIVELW